MASGEASAPLDVSAGHDPRTFANPSDVYADEVKSYLDRIQAITSDPVSALRDERIKGQVREIGMEIFEKF
jgi:hypothetical protein